MSWVALMYFTLRLWPLRTPPSMALLWTASAWQRTHQWTWSQETILHLGFFIANSGMWLKDLVSYVLHHRTTILSFEIKNLENAEYNMQLIQISLLLHYESPPLSLFHLSVTHQKPVVCSSCLDNDAKASLSQALLPLGGKLVNSWTQDCTHLVMPSVKVTIKVRTRLCILVSTCDVFLPDYVLMCFLFS